MNDFLIGIMIGALLVYSLSGIFKKRKQVSRDKVTIEIPNALYQTISETGASFEWDATKTTKNVFKLGLYALLLYSNDEGGLCFLDDLKMPVLVELEGLESGDDEDLGPFKDFIDKLKF